MNADEGSYRNLSIEKRKRGCYRKKPGESKEKNTNEERGFLKKRPPPFLGEKKDQDLISIRWKKKKQDTSGRELAKKRKRGALKKRDHNPQKRGGVYGLAMRKGPQGGGFLYKKQAARKKKRRENFV